MWEATGQQEAMVENAVRLGPAVLPPGAQRRTALRRQRRAGAAAKLDGYLEAGL
jgi:hypothetical protein